MKVKICKNKYCDIEFEPRSMGHSTCSLPCAIKLVKQKKEAKEQRAHQKKKVAWHYENDSINSFKKKTRLAFNGFIRQRDILLPCITCGDFHPKVRDKYGGIWDAGHYKSVGSEDSLRFTEINCHRQCKSCNHAGPYKADWVREQYEINILTRITQEQYDWLNGPHEIINWDRDDLTAKAKHYRAKTRELQRELTKSHV